MDVVLDATRQTNSNVGELNVLARVRIAHNEGVRLNDLFQLDVGEIIERVNMLFHQTLDAEEGREEVPLITSGVDGVCERFAVVEWLEDRIHLIANPLLTRDLCLLSSMWLVCCCRL
jgi:hypothetical protein